MGVQNMRKVSLVMNRADRAKSLLLANIGRIVTLREMAEAGVCEFYTVRNAVAEAKDLLGDGYKVTHVYSKTGIISENGYILSRGGPEATPDGCKPSTLETTEVRVLPSAISGAEMSIRENRGDKSISALPSSAPVQFELPMRAA